MHGPKATFIPLICGKTFLIHVHFEVVFPKIQRNCSAWPRLMLNTKMGLNHHTTLHHIPPTETFGPLVDKLGN